MPKPVIVVHGGAARVSGEEKLQQRRYLGEALSAGMKILASHGTALDAVEEAVALMEDSGAFDAGRGSLLNADKRAELDAAIMSGNLSLGSVACVSAVCNPVRLARAVMEKSPHCLLIGKGAEDFAAKQGMPRCRPEDLVSKRELARWKDGYDRPFGTVGAVALDSSGGVAAATSTGGTFKKLPGRVGDSPLVGCGTYADDLLGACSCTGLGEAFMKVVAAKTACDLLQSAASAKEAAEKTLSIVLDRAGGRGGLILLRNDGDVGITFNTPMMGSGFFAAGMALPSVTI